MLTADAEGRNGGGPAAGGWLLLAFRAELRNPVTPVTVGGRPLMVIRQGNRIRVADATCPHRGAHLGFGGTLVRDDVRCPFHGRMVRVGGAGGDGYRVHEYRTAELGDAVFVLLDERHENGFQEAVGALARTHDLTPGFVLPARVAAEYVIENVFDAEHFQSVHKVSTLPRLQVGAGGHGELVVTGALENPEPNAWQEDSSGAAVVTRICAHVFSPTLVLTELGPADDPKVVITGATPAPGGCVIRVAVLLRRAPDGTPAAPEVVAALTADSRTAFEQDMLVWEHLVAGAPQNFDELDGAVLTFRRFCAGFRTGLPAAARGR
jgi:3-ketosteroid 9alpha-monooxygenase subunit A